MANSHDEALRRALRRATALPDLTLLATVTSVDLAAQTVTVVPLNDEAIYAVRLTAEGSAVGVVCVPRVGSTVVVASIGNRLDAAYVAMVSDVDTVLLRGDALGGLVQVEPLVARLNALESAVNTLGALMGTHVHPVLTPAGVPFPGAPVTGPFPAPPPPIQPTVREQIENPNVKQG